MPPQVRIPQNPCSARFSRPIRVSKTSLQIGGFSLTSEHGTVTLRARLERSDTFRDDQERSASLFRERWGEQFAANHLLFFSEWCAMYLFAWSLELWQRAANVPHATQPPDGMFYRSAAPRPGPGVRPGVPIADPAHALGAGVECRQRVDPLVVWARARGGSSRPLAAAPLS